MGLKPGPSSLGKNIPVRLRVFEKRVLGRVIRPQSPFTHSFPVLAVVNNFCF